MSVTLIEASDHILGTFDAKLVEYVSKLFAQRRIRVLTGSSVARVEKNVCFLKVNRVCAVGVPVNHHNLMASSTLPSLSLEWRAPPLRPLRVEHRGQGSPAGGGPGGPGTEG